MITREQLHGWAAGALEPGEEALVAHALAGDPALAAQAEQIGAALDRDEARTWWLPPPASAGLGALRVAAGVLAGESLRPGDRFTLRIPPLPDPGRRQVVVLQRGAGDWQVVFPRAPQEAVTLECLEPSPDGGWRLDLAARPETGRQRWAVALPLPDEACPDWSAPEPWSVLSSAIRRGAVAASSVDVEVSG